MYESSQDAMRMHGIDLAQEPDFELGSLRVRPAKCEVESNGDCQILQRRVMQVLVALAHARGSVVSQDDLVMRCWRGLSVTDDAIFRCISKLRKLAAGYPDAPFSIETIPGVGYRLTSSSVDDPAAEPPAPHDRRFDLRAWAAPAALTALIFVGAAIWTGQNRAPHKSHPAPVMVRPFEVLGNSESMTSLARRIPNEVVNELGDSQIEAVLGSAQAGAEPSETSFAPAGLIVTGIVHGDARAISVNVRIEDGATHDSLWAMEFKRDSREAGDLPLEIAARVADEANIVVFARGANPPLNDNSALSALLQVTDRIRDTESDWAQMIERAQGLVARHPEFAFGHDVLAVAYAHAAENIDIPDRAKAMSEAARQEAILTLKLDREDAGAYVTLSDLEPPYNYGAREAILLRGLKFAKHPKEPLGALYSDEGKLLDIVGRLNESLSLKLVAHATDEWGAPKTAQLARAYANLGNLPAARALLQNGMQLWPNHSGIRRARQYVAGFYEPPFDALAVFDSLHAQIPSDESEALWRSYVEARAAHSAKVTRAAIDRIRGAADQGKLPREIEIMMIAGLGQTELAIAEVNSALDRHQVLEAWFLFTPITRNLRQDSGFIALSSRIGLRNYWRETGKLPDFCADASRKGECSPQLLAALKS